MRYYKLIILLLLFSCSSKRVITKKEYIHNTDTIIKTKDRVIYESVRDTILLEKPCDSLGNLKPFKTVLKTKQGNISIKSKGSNIEAKIDLDSIVQVVENNKEIRSTNKHFSESKVVIKYRLNRTALAILILSLFFNVILIRQNFKR